MSRSLIGSKESYRSKWSKVSSTLAFNYGHDTQNGIISSTDIIQQKQDLDTMIAMGVDRVRLASNYFGYSLGITAIKNLVTYAKQRGMHVIWGVDGSGFAWHTDANWQSYVDAVIENAAWAESNGVDMYQLGNEIEYCQTVTGSLTNAVGKIKNLAQEVSKYFTGEISYSVAQDALESEWILSGKGDHIGKLGYNAYGTSGDFEDWKSKITTFYNAFGSDMFVSEWSLHPTFSSFPALEADQASDISDRITWLDSSGVSYGYFFCWRWEDNSDNFALMKADGTVREWFDSLFTT